MVYDFEEKVFRCLHPNAGQWIPTLESALEEVDEQAEEDEDLDQLRKHWLYSRLAVATLRTRHSALEVQIQDLRGQISERMRVGSSPLNLYDDLARIHGQRTGLEKEAVWKCIDYVCALRRITNFLWRSSQKAAEEFGKKVLADLRGESVEPVNTNQPVKAPGP